MTVFYSCDTSGYGNSKYVSHITEQLFSLPVVIKGNNWCSANLYFLKELIFTDVL